MALFPNPPAWSSGTYYIAGDNEVTEGSFVYLCISTGTSGGTAPSWPTTFNSSVSDSSTAWTCVQHARAAWQANHAYVTNSSETLPYPWPDQVVEESTLGLWQCIVSGTSGSSQPSWPTSPNWPPNEPPNYYTQPTITDGTVTWALVGYDDE